MRIERKRLKSEITCYCHFLIFVVRHNGRSVFQLSPKIFRQFVASVRRNRFRTYYIRIDNFRRPNSVIFCFIDLKPRWCPIRSKNVRFMLCDKVQLQFLLLAFWCNETYSRVRPLGYHVDVNCESVLIVINRNNVFDINNDINWPRRFRHFVRQKRFTRFFT